MKDKFFAGSVAGMIGASVMAAANFLVNLIPGVDMKLIFGVSELFVPKPLTGTVEGAAIGLIAHLVCGSLVGLTVMAVMEKTGYDYLILKGTVIGMIAWFLLCGLLGRVLGLTMQDKFIDNIMMIIIHIPFGIATVWSLYLLRGEAKV